LANKKGAPLLFSRPPQPEPRLPLFAEKKKKGRDEEEVQS
jgi:hypothetical protein